MTYKERVYAAAKTYADSYCSYSIYEYEMDYTKFYFEGRKAIAMQAEAIRKVWMFMYQGDGSAQSLESHANDGEYYLKQNGYIPEKEEE